MAPNGHAPADPQSGDRSHQAVSRPLWHERHGSAEFKNWQKENPAQHLSYDDWKSSKHVAGLSLYYAALHIWEESDSSDEEAEQSMVGTRPYAARAQSAREPKKTLKSNGHGLSRSKGSATPSATAHSEDLSPSSKKKRKSRKKFLSQELVASDESEDVGTATPLAETTTPSAPVIAVNGRRKSSNRKPRKKPLSEETISPEDEEEDPMAMNGLVTPSIASPLPVRSAPKSSTAIQTSQPPKKTILKLSTRKTPKKKVMSEETVLEDDSDEDVATAVAPPSNITTTAEPNITATTEDGPFSDANAITNRNDATASPDPTSESAAATRRGLRTRRPAQQRPYSYDAEIFEGSESEVLEQIPVDQPPPSIESRRVSVASLSKEPLGQLDPETLAILQGGVGPEPEEEETSYGRAKHFKGKGRAWKKEESDEDLEFNPGKKKAARARAKAKAQQQQQQQSKKRGRPRKSHLSEDLVRDDSDEEALARKEQASPSPTASEGVATKKTRKPPRKSVLSEEIVHDDTEEDQDRVEDIQTTTDAAAVPEISTPAPKKRGRPRKSDQSTSSKASPAGNKEAEEAVSYTPNSTPNKSYTPKGEPNKSVSCTPKGEPKQIMDLNLEAAPASKMIDEVPDLISKDDVAASPLGIEVHMASVNADDDGGEELCK